MKRVARVFGMTALMAALAGCQAQPPVAWTPVAGGPVRVSTVAGLSVAVSQLPATDVSAFALQFDEAAVVWVRVENFRDAAAAADPAKITLSANGAPLPAYAADRAAVTDKSLQAVARALASSFKSLSSGRAGKSIAGQELQARWNESPGRYERLEDVLLSAASLAPGESAEGYVLFALRPASQYVLTVPAGSDRHIIRLSSP